MKATHLTDEEVQQYVLDHDAVDVAISMHIHSCEQCKEKAEAYRLLVIGLHEQPRERFGFPLTEMVMQRLPVDVSAPKTEKENALIYAFITVVTTITGIALYFFRKYVAGLFESFAPVFIYLSITAFVTLSILLVADVYKKYKRKIKTLDLYGAN